jgi:hypothetical protein
MATFLFLGLLIFLVLPTWHGRLSFICNGFMVTFEIALCLRFIIGAGKGGPIHVQHVTFFI